MANLIYVNPETPKKWINAGGDFTFSPASVANGAGRIGARGALVGSASAARSGWYTWYAETQCQATPTVGNLIRLYLSWWTEESTPADQDGDVGASDAAFATENDLLNLKHIGNIVVDTAAADTIFAASGVVFIPVKDVSPIWWNASGAALTADNAEHWFTLTPIPDEIQ